MGEALVVPFRVRRAVEADCGAICAIDVRSRQWGYRGLMPDDALAALTREGREPRWREALSVGSTQRVWLAEREGRGLGFAAWGPPHDPDLGRHTAELYALYVDPDAAGTGVAGQIVDEALREMRGHLYARAILWVLEDNHRARRFYERNGWASDGARKKVIRCGISLTAIRYATVVPQS